MGGVIAAGHRLTAEAGADVLRDGGTAIDAAISALAMACVCEPVLCSPGGGGFAMLRDGETGAVRVIDFFPHTPVVRADLPEPGVQEVFADFGTATQAFHVGPATSATPGFVAGLHQLAGVGATWSLGDLIAGAVGAARTGVAVTAFQHHLSTVVAPILLATSSSRAVFAPAGDLIDVGERFRNPGVADALDSLVDGGAEIAASCVATQAGRGHLTQLDLDRYDAIERAPLTARIAGAQVHLNPLPAAGGALVAHTLAQLTSADPVEFAEALRRTGDARRAAAGDLAALAGAPIRPRGTTHVSVIDATGTACAVTVSNGEGNGEIVGEFGFMLNNVLGEEDVNPAGTDAWPTDTRLSSMMCPTIIEHADGAVTALGSGGSNRIRSAIAHVISRITLGEQSIDEAVVGPRLHVEGGHLDVEAGLGAQVDAALAERFADRRTWPDPDLFFGGVHSAHLTTAHRLSGVGDRRRDGHSIVVG